VGDLFADSYRPSPQGGRGSDLVVLDGFAESVADDLLNEIERIAAVAPFRNMVVPGGHAMSVAMTNCGALGWITDRSGYRYTERDPLTERTWPAMPAAFRELAQRAAEAAGFGGFDPDACLVNRYAPGARMGLHQDRDEADFGQPIVSVSLGAPATFLWGGAERRDSVRRVRLLHGDVVVWGGVARLHYHGVAPLGRSGHRFNLTFRRAGQRASQGAG
jgi:alkylated DNA repair protein (DNA oxidative demethylase)